MRIGIFEQSVNTGTIEDVVTSAQRVADGGFATMWVPQIFGLDALTTLAIVGREVHGIELGTAVVPTYPRHPMMLAQQALTAQAASGGRLCLGIGLSHQIVIENMYGLSFAKPVLHLRDYLAILVPLSQGKPVKYRGETLSANGTLTVAGSTPFPIVVAALGPQMLKLAGREADGTLTWCVGPKTLAELTVPTIRVAAEAAGRAIPRVIAAMPVCVTDDATVTRERAAVEYAIYAQLPSYRAMLDREGAAGMADIAIVGSEAEVVDRIAALAQVGVTDFVAAEFGATPDERDRTRAALSRLLVEVA